MSPRARPERILLVTGMSGAGKTTALKTLEDLGWETVDNLPFALLDRLLATRPKSGAEGRQPLAIGIDSRTRGFDARMIVSRVKQMRKTGHDNIETLFLDCAGAELERRYAETRRRHPLAPDRAAADGIARERELIAPLRRWADHIIDTTAASANDLRLDIRSRFAIEGAPQTAITVMSFGFARGLPRNADLVFDMRYLRNPHWDEALRPLTGEDAAVAEYVAADPAYSESLDRIAELLLLLLPRYQAEGKAYVAIAFGCTGGRHRSVHVARVMVNRLNEAGFSPAIVHRDVALPTSDSTEAPARRDNRRNKQAESQ